ncbi:MAG: penicillin acylase family protein [Bryobacteraceae bacterium]
MLVAVALVAALVTVYWVVYRVLPKTSGEIHAPVSAGASITRDSLGVPHIVAGSVEDALFLQGYATAQDRLWQMELIRRFAAGELSEVLGRVTLEADRDSRRLRLRRLAEEHYKGLDAKERSYLAAYARGVNYFLETHAKSLPVEFTLLRIDPRPWSVVDSILVGLGMYRDMTASWKDELQRAKMQKGAEPAMFQYLYPKRSGGDVQPGSNAWVLGGKRTASGKPLLANDPHLEFAMPSTWYLLHMRAPGMNVSGSTLPGVPSVIIGHNERIAWGMTNLHFDVQDLYAEKLNLQTGQYLFQGKVEQARLERELIRVKGEKPVEFANWVTRHGPVWNTDGGQVLTLRWIGAEPGIFRFPMIDLDMARNWQEFRAAVSRFYAPGQNFVYADVDGNIGYQAAGKLPIRASYDGDLPADGSTGADEWTGFIPFEELPSLYNPPSGLIISANQNPFPKDFKYRVNGLFAPYYRPRQILNLLSAKSGWKPEEMLAVQKDVYSGLSLFLAKQIVTAYDKRGAQNPSLTDPVKILRDWNGQMEKDLAAPFLVSLIYQHLRRTVAERVTADGGAVYDSPMSGPALENLLRARPASWFADYDQMLLRVFVSAVEEGRRIQGRNANKWKYGEYLDLALKNPIIGQIPWIGPYFNIGPVPMSGSPTSVKQTSKRLGPSMRFVADLSDWEKSLQNITIGESGQVLSWHYKDQWDAYYTGHSFPMRFGKVEGSVLTVTPGPD